MPADLIDGTAIARAVRADVAVAAAALTARGVRPGLAVVLVGDDPASANTSFFICTGTSTALDGVYTAFGRVVEGMAVVEAIEAVPRTGETPNTRVDLKTVRVVR